MDLKYIWREYNVYKLVRGAILEASGFSHVDGLGKYLGALPHHGKQKRHGFKDVIEKMNK